MKKIATRVELAFWDLAIPLLSKSEFVRGSVRSVHSVCATKSNWIVPIVLSWLAIALIAAFLLETNIIVAW